jgi:hypothetical protein
MDGRLRIVDIAYHRNGISGVPFHVVLFEEPSEDDARVRVRS